MAGMFLGIKETLMHLKLAELGSTLPKTTKDSWNIV